MIDLDEIYLDRLSPEDSRDDFDCDDDDLNEFYRIDSIHNHKELIAITYAVKYEDNTICFFSVSNDSITKRHLNNRIARRIFKKIPRVKIYSTTPAVKIGRLATSKDHCGIGIGTRVLDLIKYSFTHGNKTGCRFVVVDAYRNEKTLNFYEKNGFDFLSDEDTESETRLMYFDLKRFKDETT